MNNLKFSALIFMLCLVWFTQAQTTHSSIELEWGVDKINKNIAYFPGAGYNGAMPIYSSKESVPNHKIYTVSNVSYESELLPSQFHSTIDKFSLGNEPKILVDSRSSRKRWFKITTVEPYFVRNNQIHRVLSVEFDVNESYPVQSKAGVQVFASESVLREGNGDWYKIEVTRTGVHKIDRAFLEDIGVDVSNLNPNHVHVFGNAQGMLPIQNDGYRPDDLMENAIFIQGDEDNVFNSNDYVLFYANGPDRLTNKFGGLNIETNIYSDVAYYYININAAESPERISNAALSAGIATHTVSKFHDVKRHEQDLENIGKTGQRWYGEHFDTQLNKSFSFSFPNADLSSDFSISSAFATKKVGGNASMDYKYNGVTLSSIDAGGNVSLNQLARRKAWADTIFIPTSGNISIAVTLNRSLASTEAWLDYIQIRGIRDLKMTGGQMNFRNIDVVGSGNIAEYFLSGVNANIKVWDVTNPVSPKLVNGNLSGNIYDFKMANDTIKEFVAFNGGQFFEPTFISRVEPQNLHALAQAELLIVTHPNFLSQASRLAELHREDGMSVNVVTTHQIYNEFSSGMQDPVAIKQFAKMFYDRSILDGSLAPVNICLFGDGSYDPKDRVPGNNYYVPVYEFENSEDAISSMVMDEFFGILDDNEAAGNADLIDIGVGRIIVSSPSQATAMVDKIEHYLKNGSNHFNGVDGINCDDQGFLPHVGDWKNRIVVVGDDEHNVHFPKELEKAYTYVTANYPEINMDKIYFDAYPQISTTGGQRFPEVNKLIDRAVDEGALFINYVGHGGETGLGHERVITVPMINSWNNAENLTTFLSATCEFCRFDDPTRVSAGEYAYLNKKGAAISLFTTTRSVYFNVNDTLLKRFYEQVFIKDANGRSQTMGELLMHAENNSPANLNKRSFTLIGDPALRLATPENRVIITHVNGHPIDSYTDTLRALDNAVIKGYVADYGGSKLTNYNGVVFPKILDKEKSKQTLGQDDPVFDYVVRENTLYKGKVTVTNGDFEFDFIIPKDIDYTYGNGKISTYANGENGEASGGDTRVIVGGVNPNGIVDSEGPQVEMYLNNPNFANGGITDETPTLIANVFDENGINTVGNGIGHDITVILDQNTANQVILNNYYEADLDTYKSGTVTYKFDELSEGTHTLTFKVWDVNNNSSEERIEFVVQPAVEITIDHVLNYPNPFTTNTKFFFEHNQICQTLETQVQIFTVSGKLVKTINENVKTSGYRTEGISWDGKDDFGDKIGRGVYVYKLTVTNPDGSKAEKLEKLVLL